MELPDVLAEMYGPTLSLPRSAVPFLSVPEAEAGRPQ
jgi:hypothetical protein